MAVRSEDLTLRQAEVVAFPVARARARAARYRRIQGRRRLATLIVGLLVVGGVVAGGGTGGDAVASRAGAPEAIVVRRGDTLWGLAARFAPADVDPRAYVDALEALNDLHGPLQAGLRIELP